MTTEDNLLNAQLHDLVSQVKDKYNYACSDFLDPRQQILAESYLRYEDVDFTFIGGFSDAERKRLAVYTGLDDDEINNIQSQVVKVLQVDIKGSGSINHRNILGSLMGIGIKREKTGDIFIRERTAYVAVAGEIAEYVKFNLTRIDKYNVEIEILDTDDIPEPEQKLKYLNVSVASLRLDCIVAAGFGLSREKAANAIKGEMVKVNWETVKSPAKEVDAAAVISLRGKGRIILEDIKGTTRKGRTSVVIKKLL